MRRRLNGLGGRRVATGLSQAVIGSLAMGGAIVAWQSISTSTWMEAGGGILGALVYAGMMLLLRVSEMQALIGVVRRRFAR